MHAHTHIQCIHMPTYVQMYIAATPDKWALPRHQHHACREKPLFWPDNMTILWGNMIRADTWRIQIPNHSSNLCPIGYILLPMKSIHRKNVCIVIVIPSMSLQSTLLTQYRGGAYRIVGSASQLCGRWVRTYQTAVKSSPPWSWSQRVHVNSISFRVDAVCHGV